MNFARIKEHLKDKRVGIAGCGGLGSNCAVALARVGIGYLTLADFDFVSESNLNRQYYFTDQVGRRKTGALGENIGRINPGTMVRLFDGRITAGDVLPVFGDCDVIVEAFDLADQKMMLIETVLDLLPGKPLVTGLGMAGWGASNLIRYRKSGQLHICGDELAEIAPDMPPLAPRVGMVANLQANVVLEILLGRHPFFSVHDEIGPGTEPFQNQY